MRFCWRQGAWGVEEDAGKMYWGLEVPLLDTEDQIGFATGRLN